MSIAITVGAISAVRQRSLLDRLTMIASLLAISAPTAPARGLTANPGRWFGSLILPWLVLAAGLAAFYARLLRSHLIEAMSQDYIRTARAARLRERRVIWRHGVRAAITPVVTALGLDMGFLLGGAVLVETVFNVPGVGRLAYERIHSADPRTHSSTHGSATHEAAARVAWRRLGFNTSTALSVG